MSHPGTVIAYPGLLRRYIALLIDVFIILALWWAFSRSPMYDAAHGKPVYWPLLLLLLYEPVLTAYLCTGGQWLMGMRVRTTLDQQRVPLWRAFIRTLVKDALGIISFILMPRQKQRRALHDLASGSVVLEARDVRRASRPAR